MHSTFRLRHSLLAPTSAFLFAAIFLFMAATIAGKPFWHAAEYSHWDSGLYLSIADYGYKIGNCEEVDGVLQHCNGNAAWFPLLSISIRALSSLGLSPEAAGVLVSNTCFFVILLVLWNLLFPEGDKFRNFLALLLAAVFPGSVYYQNIFPISLFLAGVLLSVYFIEHRKTAHAGLFGYLAAISYSTGLFFAGLFPLFFLAHRKIRWLKIRTSAAYCVAGVVVAGFVSVLAVQLYQTGRWDAFFLNQAEYGHGWNNPLFHLWDRIRPAVIEHRFGFSEAEYAQSLFVLVVMLLATLLVWIKRKVLTRVEWILYAFCLIYWVMPHIVGGVLSMYRTESVLLPIVVILRRLRVGILFSLIVMAIYFKVALSTAFFAGSLM